MRARKDGWWWRVLVGLPFVAPVCLAQPVVQEDLLKSLVEKNEAAWQKIQSLASLQYTLEQERSYPPWPQPFRAVARVKKRGDCLWSVYRFETPAGPWRVVQGEIGDMGAWIEPDVSAGQKAAMNERRVVVNSRYLAAWSGPGDGSAYCQDHNSVAEMSPWWQTVLKMSLLPPDFQYVCFGLERQRFAQALQAVSTESRHEAAEVSGEDGRRLYEIRRFDPSDDPSPDMVWTIDPQKGFLATQCVFQTAGEIPGPRQTIRVEQIAPEVWYPVACEERRTMIGRIGYPPLGETLIKTTLKEIQINEPIPDEQFEIDAMGLAQEGSGVIVTRITVDRRMTDWVYREGKLVPRE